MGNLFTKCYKFNDKENDLFENLVNNLDGDLDYDTNIEIFETDIKNTKQLEYFNNNIIKTVSNLQKKIDTIEKNINDKYEEDKNSNQNSIYTINEQINLIHKDLKSLMENDKILIEKYDEINKNTDIKTGISNNLIPNLN